MLVTRAEYDSHGMMFVSSGVAIRISGEKYSKDAEYQQLIQPETVSVPRTFVCRLSFVRGKRIYCSLNSLLQCEVAGRHNGNVH